MRAEAVIDLKDVFGFRVSTQFIYLPNSDLKNELNHCMKKHNAVSYELTHVEWYGVDFKFLGISINQINRIFKSISIFEDKFNFSFNVHEINNLLDCAGLSYSKTSYGRAFRTNIRRFCYMLNHAEQKDYSNFLLPIENKRMVVKFPSQQIIKL